MKNRFRLCISLLCIVLPGWLKRHIYRSVLGYEIADTARIGMSLVLVDHLNMKHSSKIANFVIIKGLISCRMDEFSEIGKYTWISAVSIHNKRFFRHQPDRESSLELGEHAAITARHHIDCTNKVVIGRFATIAGYNTQFLTHSLDLFEGRQHSKPIVIGEYCFVGTRCIILGGAELPPFSVLAAGSFLSKYLEGPWTLYGGVPAKKIKSIDRESKYFTRKLGEVV